MLRFEFGTSNLELRSRGLCGLVVGELWASLGQIRTHLHSLDAQFEVLGKSLIFAHILYPDFAQVFAHKFSHLTSVSYNFCAQSTGPINTTTILFKRRLL